MHPKIDRNRRVKNDRLLRAVLPIGFYRAVAARTGIVSVTNAVDENSNSPTPISGIKVSCPPLLRSRGPVSVTNVKNKFQKTLNTCWTPLRPYRSGTPTDYAGAFPGMTAVRVAATKTRARDIRLPDTVILEIIIIKNT